MEEKKYELTDETIKVDGCVLHRIKALKTFASVKKDELGGWIEKEANLSQEGDCWVYDNAKVYDNAEVFSDAKVYGNAKVFDNAFVGGYCSIFGYSKIFGNSIVNDFAIVSDSKIYGNAIISNKASVGGFSEVCGKAKVYEHAIVEYCSKICGNVLVNNDAVITAGAVIENNKDYIVFRNWWDNGDYFTWTRSNNMWNVGSFHGTGEELIEKAYNDNEESGKQYEKIVKYVESILKE